MEIKVLCFNIHKGKGWRNKKSTLADLHEQVEKLKPDVLFFQEIRGTQVESFILETWPHQSYGKNVAHNKGDYGNAIITRFPITYSENFDLSKHRFEKRGLLHSIITVENNTVHLLCVHLGLFLKGRDQQLIHIVKHITEEIPEQEAVILCGDFNDWSSQATKHLVKELNLEEAFLRQHKAYAKTFPAWAPVLKLDRIYTRGFEIKTAIRLNDKTWKNLSDHLALSATLVLKASS